MSGLSARELLACVLVLVMVSSAVAERLPIHIYTTEEGLAHANVRRIVRDPRGFLWFCTIDGLSRFDGAEFVTYRTGDGLPDPWVTDLLTTRDGTYWVATNDGVARFDALTRHFPRDGQRRAEQRAGRSFSSVAFQGSAKQRQVRVLLEDRAGRVWAGAVGGLSMLDRRVSPASFRPVVPSPAAMITSLIESTNGSLWIGTLGGLFHRRPSGDVSPEPMAVRGGVTHVRALGQDKDGRLWVGHDEGLLVLGPGAGASRPASSAVRELRSCGTGSLRDRRLRLPTRADDACTMNPGDGLVDRRVRVVTVGSDGQVRVGMVSGSVATIYGLNDIDGARITSVGPAHGLVDDPITTVAEDRDGNVWIGTDASGALRIAALGLVSYFEADGLRNDFVPFLFEDDQGRLIAVSASRFTINEFDGRRFVKTRFNVPPRVPDTGLFTVLRDHLGAWWLGTPGGLYRFPATRGIPQVARVTPDAHYAGIAALRSDELYPLHEDRRGDIWLIAQFTDQVRLVRWRRASDDFTQYGAAEGLGDIPSDWTVSRPAIVEGPLGQLFFGFQDAGLFAYRDGRFESILDRGKAVAVISLHLDRLGRLWIIGPDGTVRRLDNLSARRLTTDAKVARSLAGANVRCMVEDASGRFFFGTMSGVIEVDPASGDTWRYTTADGLAQNEVWSALASRRGDLWFGTVAGVSRLDRTRSRPSYVGSAGVDQDSHGERRRSPRVGTGRRGGLGADVGAQRAGDRHRLPGARVRVGRAPAVPVPARRRRRRLESADPGSQRQLRTSVTGRVSLPGSRRDAVGRHVGTAGERQLPHSSTGLAAFVVRGPRVGGRRRACGAALSVPRRATRRYRACAHPDCDRSARRHRCQPLSDCDPE